MLVLVLLMIHTWNLSDIRKHWQDKCNWQTAIASIQYITTRSRNLSMWFYSIWHQNHSNTCTPESYKLRKLFLNTPIKFYLYVYFQKWESKVIYSPCYTASSLFLEAILNCSHLSWRSTIIVTKTSKNTQAYQQIHKNIQLHYYFFVSLCLII